MAREASLRIHLHELEVTASVGVPDDERAKPQRLVLSLTLWPATPLRGIDDRIDDTVNYAAVRDAVIAFVTSRSDKLIETLADQLALHLLGRFALTRAEVEVRKFVLPETKYVSVIVTRDA